MNPSAGRWTTTSRKSVVSHERKQIPHGRDETECPGIARYVFAISEKMAFFILGSTLEIVAGEKWQKCGLKYVIHIVQTEKQGRD